MPVPKLSIKERGGTVHVLVLINIEPPDHYNFDYNACRVGGFRGGPRRLCPTFLCGILWMDWNKCDNPPTGQGLKEF